jgi:hypothetical protein
VTERHLGELARQPGIYVSGKTQPRDAKGKFRQVLARIKEDLGKTGLDDAINKIEEVENLDHAGNYAAAYNAAAELRKIFERLDSGALNADSVENVREAARALGEVMANLPLPFGQETQKVRFSDLPPVLRDLMKDMIARVEEKIGKEDADIASEKLRTYQSGSDVLSHGEVSGEMSKMLRLLT